VFCRLEAELITVRKSRKEDRGFAFYAIFCGVCKRNATYMTGDRRLALSLNRSGLSDGLGSRSR
jgi:hypothetical protein